MNKSPCEECEQSIARMLEIINKRMDALLRELYIRTAKIQVLREESENKGTQKT